MAYGSTRFRRRNYRGRRTSRRRWNYAAKRRRTVRTSLRRRRDSTKSAVVKLTLDSVWSYNVYSTASTSNVWRAFSFSPSTMPGFTDYAQTYSHFRILKARVYISRALDGFADGTTCNYLVVGSRPFASTTRPIATGTTSQNALTTSFVPNQADTALRQTKWQKVLYPSTTSQRVKFGFHPYTMITTNGPVNQAVSGNSFSYQRIWEGRKWTPMTWVAPRSIIGTGIDTSNSIQYFGPYIVVEDPTVGGGITANLTSTCTLELQVQFRGQK